MVCHSDCKYLRQVSSIINFLSLSDGDSYHHLQQKHLDVAILPVFETVFAASIVLYYQCVVVHYLALQDQCCIITLHIVIRNGKTMGLFRFLGLLEMLI